MTVRHGFDPETVLGDDRWIGGLARSLVRDGFEADDALQEARLALLRTPPWRVVDARPWLLRVATNFLRKRRREETRRARREALVARREGQGSSPASAMERVETRRRVLDAVLSLDEPYRATVIRRFFEDRSVNDIARMGRVSPNTVKSRLARALAMLRARLEREDGAAWCLPWLTLLPPSSAARVSIASSATTRAAVRASSRSSALTSSAITSTAIGVGSMSPSGIVAAIGISSVLLLGGLLLVRESPPLEREGTSEARNPPGASVPPPPAGLAGVSDDPRDAEAPGPLASTFSSDDAAHASAGTIVEPAPRSEPTADDAEATAAEARPSATPAVLAVRKAFRAIGARFGEGGRKGWLAVKEAMPALQELLLSSPEGLAELLALLDEETDTSLLEAVLHHLPLAPSDFREGVRDHVELHDELWARFDSAEDPERRAAFLRFFAYERSLNASAMDAFVELTGRPTELPVLRIAVDAIASNPDLIETTWESLARAFDSTSDPECRETAIHGLAAASAPGARARVDAAFSSPDERMRAAAIRAAGDRIPEVLTGGDRPGYLVAEFRAARTARYKRAIVGRFVAEPAEAFAEEIRRAIPEETDRGLRGDYEEALRAITAAGAARAE